MAISTLNLQRTIFILSIAGVIVSLDQMIKVYVHTHFFHGESLSVIPDFFNLTYVRNPGAAFGILSDSPEHFRNIFFLLLPPTALIVIVILLRETTRLLEVTALSLIIGGTLGNYIDRLRLGYVIDFLDFHIKGKYSWPAFNIADSAIVIGIIILLFFSVDPKKLKKEK